MSLWTCSTHGLTGPAACCSKSVRCTNTGENAVTDAPRQGAPDAREALAWLDKRIETATANVARMDRTLPELEDEAEWDMCKAMRDADEESVRVLRFLRERVPSEVEDGQICPRCGGYGWTRRHKESCAPALAPHAPEPVVWTPESGDRKDWYPLAWKVLHESDPNRNYELAAQELAGHLMAIRATPPQRAGVTEAEQDVKRIDALEKWLAARGEVTISYEPPDSGDWSVGLSPSAGGFQMGEDADVAPSTLRGAIDALASRVAPQGGET